MSDLLQPTEELSARGEAILGLVVREFAASAEPVGSRALVDKYGLDVSSATVRNELKRLEDMGYLTHPHTSAGRVPTHKGYRYFVQHLLGEAALPTEMQHTIRHQFYQVQQELDQWVRLSASVLARTMRSAAITTVPRAPLTRYKHVELISLQPRTILLVLVLSGGAVRQQLFNIESPRTQNELSAISAELNQRFTNMTSVQIRALEPDADLLARQIAALVVEALEHEDERSEAIFRDGLSNVLDAPEFADQTAARHLIEFFEEPSPIEPILQEARRLPGVQVIIGGERPYGHLPDIGLVISRYGQPEHGAGMLGVIGPMRMPYGRTISAVRFMAYLMSDLVANLFGETDDAPDLA